MNAVRLLVTWVINAVALLVLPYLMQSVSVEDFMTALVVAVVLGFVNTILRPILLLLTLPVTVLSLGLFVFVINGLLFWMVANIVPGFHVAGFWSAMFAAILYSIISWALSTLILKN